MEIIISLVIIAVIGYGSFLILRRNSRDTKNDMAEMAPYKVEPAKQELSLPTLIDTTVEQPIVDKPKKKAAKKAKTTAKKEPRVKIAK